MPPKKRKSSALDETAYSSSYPQTRVKKVKKADCAAKKAPEKKAPQGPRNPQALLFQAQQNLDSAIAARRDASRYVNEITQNRCNVLRDLDWTRAVKRLDSKEAKEVEVKLLEVDREVAAADLWLRDAKAAEEKCGPVLNQLWEEVEVLRKAQGKGGQEAESKVGGSWY
ncbi:hypothetical protein Slin15195_G057720 [Septoria linicola]|uniref:Uncharacterized protein n=1 Tax=Septoria linicola TaxID=215465 RepID=A0A9Q9AUN7_9PEZI|nr:hypothetical protein Slin14017_G073570 [Septoria linicola]USW52453.1 hypothetical protein Slin15195_G057720 [Septoria linicola]